MASINIAELVERLGSDEDAVRKMAVFKLQSNIGDPSFADFFVLEGGLPRLEKLALHATGNTLAYSLTSFARLLEVDKGWEAVNQRMVERVVELVVTHPLVNILRGATSILACVVSRPYTSINPISNPESFGFDALKPAIAKHPQFLEMLVGRLSTADHALCANSLQLINSLIREAITVDSESEWPKFIKRLQDLGVIKVVYGLMQSTALQDLSQPLLDFQALTKVLLRKWRDLPVDLENPDHRRALKSIHASSKPPERLVSPSDDGDDAAKKNQPNHNPTKWRRLGFETETPAWEFEDVGYLGIMDLTDYVRKYEDGFQKLLLEQSTRPAEKRCPVARASLAVTAILFEHFEIEKAELDDAKYNLEFESKTNFEKAFKPLILQWSVLHVAGLQAFFRLWNATGAVLEDFNRIYDLVRILLEAVIGAASRMTDVADVQSEIAAYELGDLRRLQIELLEITHEDIWDVHLRQIKDELSHEALQFVKEQRIRCLLAGSWFRVDNTTPGHIGPFRFAKLAPDRRFLYYADYDMRGDTDPDVDDLPGKVDLQNVTSVTSNVSAVPVADSASSSTSTLKETKTKTTTTQITIQGHTAGNNSASRPNTPRHSPQSAANTGAPSIPPKSHARTNSTNPQQRSHNQQQAMTSSSSPSQITTLLSLSPATQTLASEWLDGLLMLLNQQPITKETTKLMKMIRDYGLKIRLLNVRFDEMGFVAVGGEGNVGTSTAGAGGAMGTGGVLGVSGPEMPDREGADDEFYYEDFGV